MIVHGVSGKIHLKVVHFGTVLESCDDAVLVDVRVVVRCGCE